MITTQRLKSRIFLLFYIIYFNKRRESMSLPTINTLVRYIFAFLITQLLSLMYFCKYVVQLSATAEPQLYNSTPPPFEMIQKRETILVAVHVELVGYAYAIPQSYCMDRLISFPYSSSFSYSHLRKGILFLPSSGHDIR